MVVFDSNIIIYLAQGQLEKTIGVDMDVAYASISKIEVLGFQQITAHEQRLLELLLREYQCLSLNEAIIQQAILLRQAQRISLGDAIVAATAIEYGCELWTVNSNDFENIEDLKVINPLSKTK